VRIDGITPRVVSATNAVLHSLAVKERMTSILRMPVKKDVKIKNEVR